MFSFSSWYISFIKKYTKKAITFNFQLFFPALPQVLFRSHVKYLDNLINSWSNQFKDYNTQKAYVNGIYTPIVNKIDELDNNIYKVSEFSQEYSRLKTKCEKDGTNAYDYFNSK